jgi:hypothetical protein
VLQTAIHTAQVPSKSPVQGVYENTLANPYIRWEKARKLDIGTDISLFNNHFNITGDYYHDRYYDLLQDSAATASLCLGTVLPLRKFGHQPLQGRRAYFNLPKPYPKLQLLYFG